MSKLYAIHAYEQFFGGLHGIGEYCVVECLNEKEAEEIAVDMCHEVIEDYSYQFEEEDYDPDENIEYEIWEVKETTKSLNELNELFYNNPENFIENFCNLTF